MQHSRFSPPVNALSTRKPPANPQAEQSLIGALLLDNRLFDRVADFLLPEHFFQEMNGLIYQEALSLVKAGRVASPITLRPHFEDYPPLDREDADPVPVPKYIVHLCAKSCVPSSVRDYGQTIVDLCYRRRAIIACEDTLADIYDAPVDATAGVMVENGLSRLFELAKVTAPSSFDHSFKDDVIDTLALIEEKAMQGDGLAGLSTGIKDLDAKLGGLQPSDLIILAGRPGVGKTSLATNIAYLVAKSGLPVGVFSMEMSRQQLAMRILSERSEISSEKLRRGKVAPAEWQKLKAAGNALQPLPLHVDQTGGLSIGQLSMRARRWHRMHNLSLLVIDYLQLMQGSGNRNANRVNEITEITTGLKALGKELNIPIIALSQLSRQVEQREDKRPQLSDLRESGSIEQDADVVLFVYREEYYLEREEPPFSKTEAYADWEAKMAKAAGTAEVIIAKARHGPTGIVELAFQKELTRFSDLARGQGRLNHD